MSGGRNTTNEMAAVAVADNANARRDIVGTKTILVALAIFVALPILVRQFSVPTAGLAGSAPNSLHIVLEVLYVAGAMSMFWVGWYRATAKARMVALLDKERSEAIFRSVTGYAHNLIEASIDPMFTIDTEGLIADANRAAEHISGLRRAELVGSDFAAMFSEPGQARAALSQVLPDGEVRDLTLTVARRDGGFTMVSCNITPYCDTDGTVRGAFVVARDVSERHQMQVMLQFQASFDALTALPNLRQFHERVEWATAQARRSGRFVAVMLIDLDNFKDVNDTLGHEAGDEFLKSIGNRLVQALRETDTVARIGGDEFAVLLEDMAQAEDAQPLVNKILDTVAVPLLIEQSEVTSTCSIGISIFPNDPGDASVLLRNADTAMYRAKGAGKNNCQYFTAAMNSAVQRRVELGNRLRGGLKRDEFSLHYQPQIDLGSGAVVGVEALIRWNAEGLGPISPMDFIPIAEDTGLILPIGAWVLREACRQGAQWWAEDGVAISVAVNLSARQFRDIDIVATVERVLDETGLPPHLLELELTESMLMRDVASVVETLAQLKKTGVRIAIDDFGTGYSSLNYLKRFPLDCLKIDRSFVSDIPGDRNDEAIVRSIVTLAHSLGLKTIAEGVETVEQLAFLHELGCDEIQGYYISRPRPAADLLSFLREDGYLACRGGASETA